VLFVPFSVVIIVATSPVLFVPFPVVVIVTTSLSFFVTFPVVVIVTTSLSFFVTFPVVVIGKQCQFIKFQVNGLELIMQVSSYLDGFRGIRFDGVFDSPFKSFGLLLQESTAPVDSLVFVGLGSRDRLEYQDQGDGDQ
jgi:hypothetical protein